MQIGGAIHDVDSLDFWPAITGQNRTNPRPYLPVTAWTLLHEAGDGTMLKTCDSCRLRARGYYTSRRKRKQGEVDKREAGGDALVAMAATAPPAYARTPGPTPN